MTNLGAIITANGSSVLLLLILLLSSWKTIQNRLLDSRLFVIMVYSAIIQSVIETLCFVFDGREGSTIHVLCTVLNFFLFFNNMFFSFIWTMYADYKVFGDIKRIRNLYPFVAIPALLIIVGDVVNLFVPVFFNISADNVYQRTALFSIPFIVSYLYLSYGVILIYANRNRGNRYLFLPALIFMIPIVTGSIFQYFFYGYSLIWVGAAIALVSIYINVQNEVKYVDPLSGMFTRQYMNRFLDAEIHRSGQRPALAGILLDIDRFKSINDCFGHLTGDDAIRSAGSILRGCVPAPGFVARFAGDEFVVIMLVDNLQAVQDTMQKIQNLTDTFNRTADKPYAVSFSMGYSIYNRSDDSVDAFINRMDHAMYKNKNSKFAQKNL